MTSQKYLGDHLPDYAGSLTFARAPAIAPDRLEPGQVAVLGVPIDSWVIGRNGQRFGPRRIREQSIYPVLAYLRGATENDGWVNRTTGDILTIPEFSRIFDVGDVPVFQTDVMAQTKAISDAVATIISREAYAVLLGGDHYVPYPGFIGFVEGIQKLHPGARVGYLHIDSHLDFWDDMGAGMGRYHHGTCTRRISENNSIGNMVWFGLNGSHESRDPFDELHRRGFTAFTVAAIRRRSVPNAMREALTIASDGADFVYVSCDIDVIDGGDAPGTHSIVVAGLSGAEFLDAMNVLAEFPKIRVLDMCEVLPAFDSGDGRTSRLAALGILAWVTPKIFDIAPLYSRDQMQMVYVP